MTEKDTLFPEAEKKDGSSAQGPPTKKRRLQLRLDHDVAMKPILSSVVGTREGKFRDGLLTEATRDALKALWTKLDFVKDGVLKQHHFESVRGIDPMWEDFLDTCDVDGDGNIRPMEFVAGFVFAALDQKVTWTLPQGAAVTGFDMMKGLGEMINAHVMAEIEILKKRMGW